jgi:hypothetical protein
MSAMLPGQEDQLTPPDNLVTIAAYESLQEAYLARGLLESHGIDVFIPDENILRMGREYRGFARVRLQVRLSESTIAQELLQHPHETPEPDHNADSSARCPQCGNPNSEPAGGTLGSLLSAVLLGLPAQLTGRRVRCTICRTVWNRR